MSAAAEPRGDMRHYRIERRSVWTALAASLLTLGGGTPIALWIAEKSAPSASIVVWPNGWTVGAAACVAIAMYMFGALLFDWPLPGSAGERAIAAAGLHEAQANDRDRKRRILNELITKYRADHAASTPWNAVVIGPVYPTPEWINTQLTAMDEDWTV